MRVIAIAVVAENGVIGDGRDQPFKFREDWDRFKATTMGHPLIMGRHTAEAMGRYLPGRTTIVVSRDPEQVDMSFDDAAPAFAVGSVETALDVAATMDEVCFVAGGGQVYRAAWDRMTELDITEVHATASGSVTFPEIDDDDWRVLERIHRDRFDFTRRFPIVHTDRMELLLVAADDLADWTALHTDPRLYAHAPEAMVTDAEKLESGLRANTDRWLRDGLGYWIARDRLHGHLLGVGGVRRREHHEWNLYYRFARDAHGQGYAAELAQAAVRELAVVSPTAEVHAHMRPTNPASVAVAARLGLEPRADRVDEFGARQLCYAAAVSELADR